MRSVGLLGLCGLLMFSCAAYAALAQKLVISAEQAQIIGQKIWQNEGAGKEKFLTVWNQGEDFPSLGIGHFIWYPKGQEGPFKEQFPALLSYLKSKGVSIPQWLNEIRESPWSTREYFYHQIDSARMTSLRTLLKNTVPEQTQFIILRLEAALPKMLQSVSDQNQRQHISQRFYQVANQPLGVYALIDYVNFKGEGVSDKERYQGQGWGLLQVLSLLPSNSKNVMADFVKAADQVLTRRVENAPRDESRWLPGWRKRLQTYRKEL